MREASWEKDGSSSATYHRKEKAVNCNRYTSRVKVTTPTLRRAGKREKGDNDNTLSAGDGEERGSATGRGARAIIIPHPEKSEHSAAVPALPDPRVTSLLPR
ncbi:hypothetical protein AVEN_217803-1 [Araneus ventricosus]|uniref:Uncharacterized protein n=1 Tax=Araneus ventricosus TaxID=182803 RepID=A0A4Y2HFC2_ARAVE|nr:hypothetical protein AVEN_217803-1 [Araneus ventricosus]